MATATCCNPANTWLCGAHAPPTTGGISRTSPCLHRPPQATQSVRCKSPVVGLGTWVRNRRPADDHRSNRRAAIDRSPTARTASRLPLPLAARLQLLTLCHNRTSTSTYSGLLLRSRQLATGCQMPSCAMSPSSSTNLACPSNDDSPGNHRATTPGPPEYSPNRAVSHL